jgi:hypothetical protein
LTFNAPWNPTSNSFAEAEEQFCQVKTSSTRSELILVEVHTKWLIAVATANATMVSTLLKARENAIYDLLLDIIVVGSDNITGNGMSSYGDNTHYPECNCRVNALTAKDVCQSLHLKSYQRDGLLDYQQQNTHCR